MKQIYQRGAIVEVDLGLPPEAIKGHEQAKQRPCVVVKAFNNLQLAVVLPITTKEPPHYLYTFVQLAKGTAGLTQDSYVLCHQIRTISFDRMKRKRGKLAQRDWLKIQGVLLDALEL